MNAIEINSLHKRYSGGGDVLRGLNLEVPEGAVYGLVGRNGAGKTTCLRILMGLLRSSGGHARIFGENMWEASRTSRSTAAYVSQELRLFPAWSLDELETHLERLYGFWDVQRAGHLREVFGLQGNLPMWQMSGGQQRLAAILLALCSPAQVLVFDEPTAGLDPHARRQFMEAVVDRLADHPTTSVLFSTHLLGDLERLATHVAFLEDGVITRDVDLSDLLESTRRVQVVFPGDGPPPDLQLPLELRAAMEGPVLNFVATSEHTTLLEDLRARPDVRLQEFPLNLEELFIEWSQNPGVPA